MSLIAIEMCSAEQLESLIVNRVHMLFAPSAPVLSSPPFRRGRRFVALACDIGFMCQVGAYADRPAAQCMYEKLKLENDSKAEL